MGKILPTHLRVTVKTRKTTFSLSHTHTYITGRKMQMMTTGVFIIKSLLPIRVSLSSADGNKSGYVSDSNLEISYAGGLLL